MYVASCSCSGPAASTAHTGPADASTPPHDASHAPPDAPSLPEPRESSIADGPVEAPVPDATIAPNMPGVWRNITPPQVTDLLGTDPCTDLQYDPSNRSTLFAMYGGLGIFKSTDDGATWTAIGNLPTPTSFGRLRIDPNNPLHLYASGSVEGSSLGFWVSNDGGNTWTIPAAFGAGANVTWSNDVYNIAVDPTDFNHFLLTFHQMSPSAGVVESTDGGSTYAVHPLPSSACYGNGIAFLYDPALGLGDKNTWLSGCGYGTGVYRTSDAGASWTEVSPLQEDHGGFDAHYSTQGFLYIGYSSGVLRSTDNGLTWTPVTSGQQSNWTYSVISDGHNLYSSPAFVGQTYNLPFFVSPEGGSDEGAAWTAYSTQILPEGPWRMVFDSVNGIIYNAAWGGGAWALTVK